VRPERSAKLLADVLSLRLEYLVLEALRQQQSRKVKSPLTGQSSQASKATHSAQPEPDSTIKSATGEARGTGHSVVSEGRSAVHQKSPGAMHQKSPGAMHQGGPADPAGRAPGLAEPGSERTVGGLSSQPAGGGEQRASAAKETAGEPQPLFDFAVIAEQPIAAVRLTAGSVPVPLSRQRRLFVEAGEESQEVSEQLGILLSRLAGRLGPESVLVAAERDEARPEHSVGLSSVAGGGFEEVLDQLVGADSRSGDVVSRRKSGRAGSPGRSGRGGSSKDHVASAESLVPGDQPAFRPPRPLRLLTEPLEVSLEWHAVESVTDRFAEAKGADATLRMWGREWNLVEWTGPERIQTAWWTDSACQRDYYQGVSDRGSRFWLFRDLATGRWYLQGIYD
jgi:hypothetical protein